VRAVRNGWLPFYPQFEENPLELTKAAKKAGKDTKDYIVDRLTSGSLRMSCEDPDDERNFPRNLFIWRSNLLGSSGKGHEYMLKHLLGTKHGVLGKDLGELGGAKPTEVTWHDEAPEGKLDLVVTLDFRMSTTAVYSDIVLPAATWYEKNDLNTSDMHPFIHPLTGAVDPVWECKSDWDICAGDLLVTEAGGCMTSMAGAPLAYNQATPRHATCLACNRPIHAALVTRLSDLADKN